MKSFKWYQVTVLAVILIFGIFNFFNTFIQAEEASESYGYTVIDKNLSMHSANRPYSQYKDDVVIVLTLEKDGKSYQGYYQKRFLFFKTLYVSKYDLESEVEYLTNATHKSIGSKYNFDKYKISFKYMDYKP